MGVDKKTVPRGVWVCGRACRKEGTGTLPDYLVNRADKKIEGPFGGKKRYGIRERVI